MSTRLTTTAEFSKLPEIRKFVQTAANDVCAYEQFAYDAALAIDELVTNIIVHGYKGFPGKIQVEVKAEPGLLTIILRDRALEFDPTLVSKPDVHQPLEERKIGGLGIFLAIELTDSITYQRLPNGVNELILTKSCPVVQEDSFGPNP